MILSKAMEPNKDAIEAYKVERANLGNFMEGPPSLKPPKKKAGIQD